MNKYDERGYVINENQEVRYVPLLSRDVRVFVNGFKLECNFDFCLKNISLDRKSVV